MDTDERTQHRDARDRLVGLLSGRVRALAVEANVATRCARILRSIAASDINAIADARVAALEGGGGPAWVVSQHQAFDPPITLEAGVRILVAAGWVLRSGVLRLTAGHEIWFSGGPTFG